MVLGDGRWRTPDAAVRHHGPAARARRPRARRQRARCRHRLRSPGTAVGDAGPAERDAVGVGAVGRRAGLPQRPHPRRAVTQPAVAEDDGRRAGGAAATSPSASVTAIVGVATLPSARRRGLAALVTARLVQDARERGAELVFLDGRDADVARIYGRLGFERVGTACIAEPLWRRQVRLRGAWNATGSPRSPHGDRPFHTARALARIDEAIDRLELGRGDRVLDVGCGPGELLVRIAERTGAGGLGVDTSPVMIEQARRRASARARGADLEFAVRQGSEPEGTFAAACCLGSSHALGGLEPALERLAAWIGTDGAVLLADGFWQREPDPAFLEALRRSEPRRAALLRGAPARRARGRPRAGLGRDQQPARLGGLRVDADRQRRRLRPRAPRRGRRARLDRPSPRAPARPGRPRHDRLRARRPAPSGRFFRLSLNDQPLAVARPPRRGRTGAGRGPRRAARRRARRAGRSARRRRTRPGSGPGPRARAPSSRRGRASSSAAVRASESRAAADRLAALAGGQAAQRRGGHQVPRAVVQRLRGEHARRAVGRGARGRDPARDLHERVEPAPPGPRPLVPPSAERDVDQVRVALHQPEAVERPGPVARQQHVGAGQQRLARARRRRGRAARCACPARCPGAPPAAPAAPAGRPAAPPRPSAASVRPATGPAITRVRSSTRTPEPAGSARATASPQLFGLRPNNCGRRGRSAARWPARPEPEPPPVHARRSRRRRPRDGRPTRPRVRSAAAQPPARHDRLLELHRAAARARRPRAPPTPSLDAAVRAAARPRGAGSWRASAPSRHRQPHHPRQRREPRPGRLAAHPRMALGGEAQPPRARPTQRHRRPPEPARFGAAPPPPAAPTRPLHRQPVDVQRPAEPGAAVADLDPRRAHGESRSERQAPSGPRRKCSRSWSRFGAALPELDRVGHEPVAAPVLRPRHVVARVRARRPSANAASSTSRDPGSACPAATPTRRAATRARARRSTRPTPPR